MYCTTLWLARSVTFAILSAVAAFLEPFRARLSQRVAKLGHVLGDGRVQLRAKRLHSSHVRRGALLDGAPVPPRVGRERREILRRDE